MLTAYTAHSPRIDSIAAAQGRAARASVSSIELIQKRGRSDAIHLPRRYMVSEYLGDKRRDGAVGDCMIGAKGDAAAMVKGQGASSAGSLTSQCCRTVTDTVIEIM